MKEKNEKGGVAIEYILVSTFAAVAASLVLGVMGTIAKNKISTLVERYGVEADFDDLDHILK